jgi:hypothetical protein
MQPLTSSGVRGRSFSVYTGSWLCTYSNSDVRGMVPPSGHRHCPTGGRPASHARAPPPSSAPLLPTSPRALVQVGPGSARGRQTRVAKVRAVCVWSRGARSEVLCGRSSGCDAQCARAICHEVLQASTIVHEPVSAQAHSRVVRYIGALLRPRSCSSVCRRCASSEWGLRPLAQLEPEFASRTWGLLTALAQTSLNVANRNGAPAPAAMGRGEVRAVPEPVCSAKGLLRGVAASACAANTVRPPLLPPWWRARACARAGREEGHHAGAVGVPALADARGQGGHEPAHHELPGHRGEPLRAAALALGGERARKGFRRDHHQSVAPRA